MRVQVTTRFESVASVCDAQNSTKRELLERPSRALSLPRVVDHELLASPPRRADLPTIVSVAAGLRPPACTRCNNHPLSDSGGEQALSSQLYCCPIDEAGIFAAHGRPPASARVFRAMKGRSRGQGWRRWGAHAGGARVWEFVVCRGSA